MKEQVNSFLKYFNKQPNYQKEITIDLIKDIINGIEIIEEIKDSFYNLDDKQQIYFNDIINFFKEIGLNNISGFLMYKKTDFTQSKNIQEYFDTSNEMNVSKIAVNRRFIIIELIKNNLVSDLDIDSTDLFNEEEMKENKIILNKEGKKIFDFNKIKFNEKEKTITILGKKEKINKKNIGILGMILLYEDFIKFYGKQQLNKELNLDDSYKQILLYKADKKILNDLYSKLESGKDKIYINKIEYKKNGLYINGNKFNFGKDTKTSFFIKLLSKYFSENTDKREISRGDFIDFFYKNTKNKNVLNLKDSKNIKNSYIKTIHKKLGKKYINNEILEIKKDVIITK